MVNLRLHRLEGRRLRLIGGNKREGERTDVHGPKGILGEGDRGAREDVNARYVIWG